MSRLNELPPDQRAALSLLLRQRKSYAEVAAMLHIAERGVHDRAHAALAVLAPRQARELTPQLRDQIGDYLLGQQPGLGERLRTRTLLEQDPQGRAWARAIAEQLAPLATGPLPEIPDGDRPPGLTDGAAGEREQSPQAVAPPDGSTPAPGAAAPGDEPAPAASSASEAPVTGAARPLRSSRLGGAVLLAAIVAGVIVAVVLLTGGGGSSHQRTGASGAAAASTSGASSSRAGATAALKAKEDKRIALTPTEPSSKAIGIAEVLSEGNQYAFYLAAEHLPPSKGFFYAVWLYNSPSSHEALSKAPPVGADGRLQGGALLPANAGDYHQMLITRETNEHPTQPGPVVLSGEFGLH